MQNYLNYISFWQVMGHHQKVFINLDSLLTQQQNNRFAWYRETLQWQAVFFRQTSSFCALIMTRKNRYHVATTCSENIQNKHS